MKSAIRHSKPKIVIAGAGPAGTSAAIRLAQKGFTVSLIEREKFPRQKLCGEFISPECFRHFKDLGVSEKIFSFGGERIAETIFYGPGGKSVNVPSKWFNAQERALGLSRAEMDFCLLQKARAVGVEVFEETQVVGLLIENERVCGVKTKSGEIRADLSIDATGRARVLGKLAERELLTRGRRVEKTQKTKLVGFKAHLKNIRLEKGRCEIYFFRGGYGGLNYVENGVGNHCFLIKAEVVREFNGDVERILNEVIFQNRRAKETLQGATPVFDWLAVAVDGFGLKDLNPAPHLLAVGDAGAFIDPFTGSGMLMALECGEILAQVIEGNSTAQEISQNYQQLHFTRFQKRLRICNLLRRAAFTPNLAASIIHALSLIEKPREFLVRATRPKLPALEK